MNRFRKLFKKISISILIAVLLTGCMPNLPVTAAEPEVIDMDVPQIEDGIEEEEISSEEASWEAEVDEVKDFEEEKLRDGEDPSEEGQDVEDGSEPGEEEEGKEEEANLVTINVTGPVEVKGIDGAGRAKIGKEVSIEVLEPGYVLAASAIDENGNPFYIAMELDGNNTYKFIVEGEMQFIAINPSLVEGYVKNAETNKAKYKDVEELKLDSLSSNAQSHKEVVLNFKPVKNDGDGEKVNNVYYEVKITGIPDANGYLPRGIGIEPKYVYIPKKPNGGLQSKNIEVNYGFLPESTVGTYEFSVKLVYINKDIQVPEESVLNFLPLQAEAEGNTLTKRYSTKEAYVEDNLKFTKKTTTLYTGQQDVLMGRAKYSRKGSNIHDLTAVVCDINGQVENGFTCEFRNDNDELYISTAVTVKPGQYIVVVYAGTGESGNNNNPQGGTMYQSNTSFNITVKQGIDGINTDNISKKVAVNFNDVTFSAVPVGYGWNGKKAATQKFTYEIKSLETDGESLVVTDANLNVKRNVKINSKGKVTIKKAFNIEEDESRNYFAIVIKAADYKGNTASETVYIQVVSTNIIPAKIYLANDDGKELGNKVTADQADGANVVVLDEYGQNMNRYVTITPVDNSAKSVGAYVRHSFGRDSARLYVRKAGTYTLKATTKDGGNKTVSLVLRVDPPVFTKAGYEIADIIYNDINCTDYKRNGSQVLYRAPRGAVVNIRLGGEINGQRYFQNKWYDWEYKIEGGTAQMLDDYWAVKPTERDCILTIWKKSTPDKCWEVELTNENWDSVYNAAPRLEQMRGTAYVNQYSNAVVPGAKQQLTFQYESGVYERIEVKPVSKAAPAAEVSDLDSLKKTFKLELESVTNCKAGIYIYRVGFFDKDGKMACKPTTIKVRLNPAPKVKVLPNYTMDLKKENAVTLKNNTAGFMPAYSTFLLNANVRGKANSFNKYFELTHGVDQNGESIAMIRLKNSVTDEQMESLKGKVLTGYVKYSYVYGNSEIKDATSKVSIKVK